MLFTVGTTFCAYAHANLYLISTWEFTCLVLRILYICSINFLITFFFSKFFCFSEVKDVQTSSGGSKNERIRLVWSVILQKLWLKFEIRGFKSRIGFSLI